MLRVAWTGGSPGFRDSPGDDSDEGWRKGWRVFNGVYELRCEGSTQGGTRTDVVEAVIGPQGQASSFPLRSGRKRRVYSEVDGPPRGGGLLKRCAS